MRLTEILVAVLLILGIVFTMVYIISETGLKYIGKMDIQGATIYVYKLGNQYYLCTQEIDSPCFLTSNTLVCNSGSCIRASYIYNGSISR